MHVKSRAWVQHLFMFWFVMFWGSDTFVFVFVSDHPLTFRMVSSLSRRFWFLLLFYWKNLLPIISKNFELLAMYVLWSSLGLFPSRTDCLTATRGSFESFLPTSSSNVSLRTEDTWKTRKVGGPCPHPLTTALPQKTPLTISTILYQWIRTEDGELS